MSPSAYSGSTGRHLFTSESVTEGHPDKLADQLSDAILDEVLRQDPGGRVACEAVVSTGLVLLTGEITSSAVVDYADVARRCVREAGYTRSEYGMDADRCAVLVAMDRQSRDIAEGIKDGGAGDQGMMYGYACDETDELMPLPITLAHRIAEQLDQARKEKAIEWLRPDGKSQVTVEYAGGRPRRIDTVVVSAQHDKDIGLEEVRRELERKLRRLLPPELMDEGTRIRVNPADEFVEGGPKADAGLTGRKVMVDSYGGWTRHGGGAFSGKDGTKVDRSAAYAARWAARTVVQAGAARRCEVRLAYAIGETEPVQVSVYAKGTNRMKGVDDAKLEAAVREVFDNFRPQSIIDALRLRDPIFKPTAAYGHFGRTPRRLRLGRRLVRLFPWERADRVQDLKEALHGAC